MAAELLTDLRRRLRRTSQAPEPEPAELSSVEEPVREVREVEFAAYTEDCRLFGFARLDTERLTDFLNEHEQVVVSDVMVVALEDGQAGEAKELTVERAELLAVRATGPRGNPGRRGRMRPYPVTLQTGPYTIHGYLHALPGADPLKQLRLRKTMVPLTESWIEYASGGEAHRARVGTIIINRELLDWIRPSRDVEVRLPDLPAEAQPDPRAKDLTGYIWMHHDEGQTTGK
jgi:hypothetical protein